MATTKTHRTKVLRVFASADGHVKDLKYHDLSDYDTDKQNRYCNFQFSHSDRPKSEIAWRISRIHFSVRHTWKVFVSMLACYWVRFELFCYPPHFFIISSIFLFVVNVRLTRNTHSFSSNAFTLLTLFCNCVTLRYSWATILSFDKVSISISFLIVVVCFLCRRR